MIRLRISTNIKEDRRVIVTLPPDVPTGQAEVTVIVEHSVSAVEPQGTRLADWVEERTEPNANEHVRYPLRGSVVHFEQATEPVAEGDWEALG